jgi:NAD(P)H-dependent FMN reductase
VAKVGVIVGSVREGRVGLPVAEWFVGRARAHGAFEPVLLDLKAIDLPMLTTSKHPRLGGYELPATQAWAAQVKACDAFVFVMPEYNHGLAPALVNALDHLSAEWQYKACSFVSYGGISAGLRAVAAAKPVVSALKMVALLEGVPIPFVTQLMADGAFTSNDTIDKAAGVLLDELRRWDGALRTLRS